MTSVAKYMLPAVREPTSVSPTLAKEPPSSSDIIASISADMETPAESDDNSAGRNSGGPSAHSGKPPILACSSSSFSTSVGDDNDTALQISPRSPLSCADPTTAIRAIVVFLHVAVDLAPVIENAHGEKHDTDAKRKPNTAKTHET
mmetsp:Transcript_52534/g.77838  ORF Transcript_52534/g.77838 Transcript_52534/m.77838 type:complete len:146 (-) Transcript_52534:153-590(-)